MLLTRIELNLDDRAARTDLADPYEMHSTLARLMAPAPSSAPAKFLWRLEPLRQGAELVVLIQSEVEPRWEALGGARRDWCSDRKSRTLDIERLSQNPEQMRFRLRANPTVTRMGKRHGLIREEEQLRWLHRQSARLGFELLGCQTSESTRMLGRRRKGGGAGITVQSVLFDGVLRISDPSAFRQALVDGVGHAKVLGLGLLSVAPVAR